MNPGMTKKTKIKVLIVQASKAQARQARDVLSRDRFSLSFAPGVEEASSRLQRRAYDIVLMSWQPPSRACKTICRELRKTCPSFVPIIMLGDTPDEAKQAEKVCAQAQQYVIWPRLSEALIKRSIDFQLAEWELHEQWDFNTTILETVDALIMVLDPKGKISLVNKAFEETLGYDLPEMEGKGCWTILSDRQVRKKLRDIFAQGSLADLPKKSEDSYKTKDGEDRLISWSHSRLEHPDGSTRNVICTGLDITEHKQAEQTLSSVAEELSAMASDTFFESLVESLAVTLGVEHAFIGELSMERDGMVQTIAVHYKGKPGRNFEYNLANAPCRIAAEGKFSIFPKDVQKNFPKDKTIVKLGLQGYIGAGQGKVLNRTHPSVAQRLEKITQLPRRELSGIDHLICATTEIGYQTTFVANAVDDGTVQGQRMTVPGFRITAI